MDISLIDSLSLSPDSLVARSCCIVKMFVISLAIQYLGGLIYNKKGGILACMY